MIDCGVCKAKGINFCQIHSPLIQKMMASYEFSVSTDKWYACQNITVIEGECEVINEESSKQLLPRNPSELSDS